jgi:hypothetical protein
MVTFSKRIGYESLEYPLSSIPSFEQSTPRLTNLGPDASLTVSPALLLQNGGVTIPATFYDMRASFDEVGKRVDDPGADWRTTD